MDGPTVSFLAVGDVYLDRPDAASAFREWAGLIRAADLAFCNLEGPCSELGTGTIGKFITIRMRPEVVPVLAAAGFNVVSFANNHALDYGYEAFLDTLGLLDAAGIACVGGGRNLAEARRPVILERNRLRLGFLAYATTLFWGYEATDERPGIAPVRVQTYYEPHYQIMSEQPGTPATVVTVVNSEDLAVVRDEVRRTKENADAIVVSFHWGVAFLSDLAPYQPELAHAVIEAGADLVVGHHAHVLQGVEVYQGVPILYGLSHFVFDHDDTRYGQDTILVTARFGVEGLERVAVRPAIIPPRGDPRPVSQSEGERIKVQLERLSSGMNSQLQWEGDEIKITAADS